MNRDSCHLGGKSPLNCTYSNLRLPHNFSSITTHQEPALTKLIGLEINSVKTSEVRPTEVGVASLMVSSITFKISSCE